MLIISIGHSHLRDPFTYTCVCEDDVFNPHNMAEALTFIYKEHSILPSNLHQVLIIRDDQVLMQYDNEDGLGNEDADLYLELC